MCFKAKIYHFSKIQRLKKKAVIIIYNVKFGPIRYQFKQNYKLWSGTSDGGSCI
jgi:hypothetical protein